MDTYLTVSREVEIPLKHLLELVQQVENGVTTAFLARYRADLCAGLDEQQVEAALRRLRECRDLQDRRIAILTQLRQRGALTPELQAQLEKAADRRDLNDIFLPYSSRGRDGADMAIEKGLDPLARALWFQSDDVDLRAEARKHADPERGVESPEQALEGAYLIAARWLSEKPEILRELRKLFRKECDISVTARARGRAEPRVKAMDGYRGKAADVPWQKRLLIRRGIRTGQLESKVASPLEAASRYLERCLIKDAESAYAPHLKRVVEAALQNGLSERVRRDVLVGIERRADSVAIESFCKALRDILLAPTAHGVRIVGIETGRPGGWRAVLIDGEGELVDCAIVREGGRGERGKGARAPARRDPPAPDAADAAAPAAEAGNGQPAEAPPEAGGAAGGEAGSGPAKVPGRPPLPKRAPRRAELCDFLRDRDVDLVVFPSGPQPHSTERYIRSHIRRSGSLGISWMMVRGSRTWGYASSKASKREFPRLDMASRSAVSLARRVQDPLAELVKADPKTLAVGVDLQEVNAERLRKTLRSTVRCVVHEVGVDANRAPVALLALVPGFTERLARRVVKYRKAHGPFRRRDDLRKVEGLGERIFAQAVGFLRVRGEDPLDSTGAHPEYRKDHERLAEAAGCDVPTLLAEPSRLEGVDPEQFATEERSALFFESLIEEFKPARRRVRRKFALPRPVVPLRSDEELLSGGKVAGVVASISDFGAWVDIGGDKDALLHVSQIRREHVRDSRPSFAAGDEVEVYVRPPEEGRKRISLTMWDPKSRPPRGQGRPFRQSQSRTFDRRGAPGGRPGGRFDRRKTYRRTFGPAAARRPKGSKPAGKLTLQQKLDLLQDKYRTKI